MRARVKGSLIAVVGVICVTPDAVLIRWATKLGATMIMVLFWKLFFNVLFGSVMVVLLERRAGRTIKDLAQGWRLMATATTIQSLIAVSFPLAFLLTLAANVLLLVAVNPIWCALMSWFFLNETLPWRTVGALVASVGAIIVMFLPKILHSGVQDDRAHLGNLVALFTGFLLSSFLVVARVAGKSNVSISAASIFGSFTAASALGLTAIIKGLPLLGPSPFFYVAMAIDGFGLASVYVAFSIAPHYISGAQVGLIWMLEIILGPLWCFVIYGETPPPPTLLGGTLLLLAVFCHEYLAMLADKDDVLLPTNNDAPLKPPVVYAALETEPVVDVAPNDSYFPALSSYFRF